MSVFVIFIILVVFVILLRFIRTESELYTCCGFSLYGDWYLILFCE